MVVITVYLIGGVLFNNFARGASGAELVPNVSFWKEFPILVKVRMLIRLKIWHTLKALIFLM